MKRHEILSSDAYRETLGRFLREPLVHFLLLGALTFGAFKFISSDTIEPGKILISQGRIESLEIAFSRTWRRPPTASELEGLIRDYVREEVFAREAVALGLDKDDTIIRRRLRQKLEFVSEDVVALAEPTDDKLGKYLKAHADTFRVQRQFTFSHVYLSPERRGENLARDAAQLLAQLRQAGGKADVSALGDPFLLEYRFEAAPATEIAKHFGEKFATELGKLAPGEWQGPVESGYGLHMVWVSERTEGRVPALAEVRDAVRREWASAGRLEANEKFYQALLKRYVVTIERPEVAKNADANRVAEAQR